MKRLLPIFAVACAGATHAEMVASNGRSDLASVSEYKFWITESGDEICQLGPKFYINQLHPWVTERKAPRLKYHVDGKPAGPALIVSVEGISLSIDRCYWRVETRVVSYDLPGYQLQDRLTEYYIVGPQRVFGDRRTSDLIEKIQSQVDFLSDQMTTLKGL